MPIKIDVKSHNSENLPYLTIEGSDACGTAFVKFKLDDIIREYYVLNNIYDGLEIWSKRDWDNYEIEIFNDENLIYKAKHNIIRAINLNVGITTKIIEKNIKVLMIAY